jgi:F-type H+-transporting ATPase subunit b
MRRRFLGRWTAILFAASLVLGNIAAAQNSSSEDQAKQNAEQHNAAAEQSSAGDGNTGIGEILAKTTEQSAHTAEKWGHKIGLGPDASFLISLLLNFAGVFALFFFLLKSKLPQAFRERTAAIQKGIKDAEAASADASRRLSEIETRLAKLDSEVGEIRAAAERDVAAEEQHIKQAAEEDKQKVIAAAQAEIAAIARSARRELKGYAASLAVDLAAREIRVDEPTDQALVREFVDQLGKDGK